MIYLWPGSILAMLILGGDLIQANVAQRFSARQRDSSTRSPLPSLSDPKPCSFAALLRYGKLTIASSSLERFLTPDGRNVETRPVRGKIAFC
ncbi:anthranilate/para-aminobenzoate synthase component I [Bradyrhizobium sp. GM6.1]